MRSVVARCCRFDDLISRLPSLSLRLPVRFSRCSARHLFGACLLFDCDWSLGFSFRYRVWFRRYSADLYLDSSGIVNGETAYL